MRPVEEPGAYSGLHAELQGGWACLGSFALEGGGDGLLVLVLVLLLVCIVGNATVRHGCGRLFWWFALLTREDGMS